MLLAFNLPSSFHRRTPSLIFLPPLFQEFYGFLSAFHPSCAIKDKFTLLYFRLERMQPVKRALASEMQALPEPLKGEHGCALARSLRARRKRARAADVSLGESETGDCDEEPQKKTTRRSRVTEMTVAELRLFLRARGLRQSGSKRELLSRAMAASASECAAPG